MNPPPTCPNCGKPIPDEAPFGLCGCGLLADVVRSETKIDSDLEAEPLRRVGPYHVVSKLGEGAFGIVYLALQEWPVRRRVALKVLKPGVDSAQVTSRFEIERQSLARMDHPNVATIYDAGETDEGLPYFVMEPVAGLDLKTFCQNQALDLWERLRVFAAVCRGVHHAHQKGIIHRDLKPGNVIVQMENGEPLPKVIDFGIAKALESHAGAAVVALTKAHQVIGTVSYMSPEQAGGHADVDARADIYSLGTVLYELLVGVPPFSHRQLRDQPQDEVLRTIRETNPPLPSNRAAQRRAKGRRLPAAGGQMIERVLRGDLDNIVMRAMEKDPNHRYDTAQELVDDIERHLRNEPVLASHPSRLYRAQKFLRKHRPMATATAAVFLALVTTLSVSIVMLQSAEQAREREVRLREDIADEIRVRQSAQETLDSILEKSLEELYAGLSDGGDLVLLRDLSGKALAHYASLESPGDPAGGRGRAQLFFHLGRVFVTAGEVGQAMRAFEEALEIFDGLTLTEPADAMRVARCLLEKGRLESAEEALTSYRRAIDRLEAWAGPETQALLGEIYREISVLHERHGAIPDAIAAAEKEAAIWAELEAPQELSETRLRLAEWYRVSGQPARAESVIRTAVSELEAIPRDDRRDHALAQAHREWAAIDLSEHPEEARAHYEEALRLLMGKTDPSLMWLEERARVLELLTDLSYENEEVDQAREHQLGVLNTYTALVDRSPANSQWVVRLIEAHLHLGAIKASQNQHFLEHWMAGKRLLDRLRLVEDSEKLLELGRELTRLKARWSRHRQSS